MRTEQDVRSEILAALEQHVNKHHGQGRYNTPWRPGADGGTLAVTEDAAYAYGLSWYDHKTLEGGNGITLAQRLGIRLADREPDGIKMRVKAKPTKRAYASLEAYAEAHGVPLEAFERVGWAEVTRARQLAFAFPTANGMRYRYADEERAGRKFDQEKGCKPCWYGLPQAIAMAGDGPIIIANGEPSVVAAQWRGLPACCVTGGERGSLAANLEEELRDVWSGSIVVAFDNDNQGMKSGPALATHLRTMGYGARAVHLGGHEHYDLADWCRDYGTIEQLLKLPTVSVAIENDNQVEYVVVDWRASGKTLAQLQTEHFPPDVWVVESVLPAGVCLLAAKPKAKKSWLALAAGLAVARGTPMFGRLSVEQGRVLYLDLESTQKRIKKRTMSMLGSRAPWPDNFHIFTEWPQGPEGLTQLEAWLQEYPDTKLIVIDVLASFRRPMDRNDQIYLYDRETVKPINDLCERYSCAALLVHHVNKAKPDDVFDTISGSTGLQSVCNTMWVLSRAADDNAQTVFSIRGRDIENDEPLSLRWDDYASMHVLEGKAAELAVSGERAAILKALDDDEARSPSEIAELVGNSVGNVKRLLGKMLQDGQVDKSGYGKWSRVRGTYRSSGNSGNSGISGISGISGNSVEEIPQELPRVTESYRRDTGDLGLSDAVNRQEIPEIPELPLQTRILHIHGLWYAFEPDGTVIGPKQSREELNA